MTDNTIDPTPNIWKKPGDEDRKRRARSRREFVLVMLGLLALIIWIVGKL